MHFDLTFLHCHATPFCDARIDKYFSDYFTLQLMEVGAVELSYNDKNYDLRDGAWFWPAFPGPRIRFGAARDVSSWNHRYAAFSGPLVEHWRRAGLWLDAPQRAPDSARDAATFDEILHHIERGGSWGTRRAINRLEALLLELAEARQNSSHVEAAWLVQARLWLEQTDEFSPDYADLARELGLGLSTLRRQFKAATGMTLHEALMATRLDRARRLLGETDVPIKAIASQLGYRDVGFFANQFKRLSGVTPATYRRSRQ